MSLEAIAALLGHRSMKINLTYARITDTTIAEEYVRVTAAAEANNRGDELPATTAGNAITQLATDHRRLLGTATAAAEVPSTAPTNPSASGAGSSKLAPSSCPSSSANAITPSTTTNPDRAHLFTGLLDNPDNTT